MTNLSFNSNGTRILFSCTVPDTYEMYTSVYNLETGEETILPIAGTHPQWVD
ncbi:MAG: hypothetical protein AAF846_17135 [Chloroflexota bacterium]